MEAGRRLGDQSGAFRVPTTSSVDSSNLTFNVERISGFRPLSNLMSDPKEAGPLLHRAGSALGKIHSACYSTSHGKEPLFHGDFDLHNVGLDEKDQLVLLDWDGAPGLETTRLSMQSRDVGILQFSLVSNALRLGHSPRWIQSHVETLRTSYCQQMSSGNEVDRAGMEVFRALVAWKNVPGDSWVVRSYRWVVRRAGYLIYAGLKSRGLSECGARK